LRICPGLTVTSYVYLVGVVGIVVCGLQPALDELGRNYGLEEVIKDATMSRKRSSGEALEHGHPAKRRRLEEEPQVAVRDDFRFDSLPVHQSGDGEYNPSCSTSVPTASSVPTPTSFAHHAHNDSEQPVRECARIQAV